MSAGHDEHDEHEEHDAPPLLEGAPPRPRAYPTRKHVRCATCALPLALCFCETLEPIAQTTRVLVVQHRNEEAKTSNSARLAVKLLAHGALEVRGKKGAPPPVKPEGPRLALFPGGRPLAPSDAGALLVVPDGNWTQARRLACQDIALHDAELVALPAPAPSRFRLRRSPRPGAVCTFEAIAAAAGVLEGTLVEARMLEVFERFIALALAFREGGPIELIPSELRLARPSPAR